MADRSKFSERAWPAGIFLRDGEMHCNVMIRSVIVWLVIVLSTVAVPAQWQKQNVDTKASFRGLSVVSEKVVWASGSGGTVIKTIDGGESWEVMTVPGAAELDFRDIEAFDAKTAYVLSIGNGDASRIYKTTDGGKTWKEQFLNDDKRRFFDALACWDTKHCIAMSDPVDGHYRIIGTNDGEMWQPIESNQMAAAKDGEAAFAASGTCLIAHGETGAMLVSGGSDARVFRSNDRGSTWTAVRTPIIKGAAGSGIFSVAFRGATNGVIVGGNYEKPSETAGNLALTTDGGATWTAATGLGGYRSGVAYIDKRTIIAVGTTGTDISRDGGKTWRSVGSEDLNAVAARGKRSVWAVGPKGLVVRMK